MRKYKFRYVFKHKKDGDCQYLFFTIKEIENGYAKEMIYAMKQDGYTLVDRNEFAGLKDKNGKEIYEGDILTSEHYPFQDEGKYNYHGVIEWIDECAAFYMTKRLANNEKRGISDGIAEPIEEGLEEFEIIGNIYENPELLKGEENA